MESISGRWKNINKEQAFIKLEKKYIADINSNISLKDVADISCSNGNIQKFLEGLKVYGANNTEENVYISSTDIISKIQNQKDNVDVVMVGEQEILIQVQKSKNKNIIVEFLKVFLICIVLFLGAGLAIINFHEDVNMKKSMERIYYIITGESKDNPLMLVIPYSIGIGVGMWAFFGRMIGKSKKDEPGPLEVENYLYDKNVGDFLTDDLKNKKQSK